MAVNEAETRARQIDVQLARAGWTVAHRTLVEEFLIGGRARPFASGPDFAA